jgi:predicted transcriptional regulator of viral defense system
MRQTGDTPRKTLGPKAARLVAELHERSRQVFGLREVENILGLPPNLARSFVAQLVRRGVVTRLKPGLFHLVPFELGHAAEYVGNPYIVARELAGGRDYFLSHASAMEIHQMVTQPQLVVYVTSLKPLRRRVIRGTEMRFVRCRRDEFFGVTERWIEKHEQIAVSDPERTIIDGLRSPDYCGGIVEVAKGFRMRREALDPERLVAYALRLGRGAVIRRLGFLMELWNVSCPKGLDELQSRLTATYVRLDPGLPAGGRFLRRWRVQLNVTPEELRAAVRT